MWILREENKNLAKEIQKTYGLSSLSSRLLAARKFDTEEKIKKVIETDELADPAYLKNIEKSADFLISKRKKNLKVGIMGDYDVDGVTSTVLLREYLRRLQLKVVHKIPDRKEGYSLTKKAVDFFISKQIKILFTVDCGIANIEEIKALKEKNIETVVLDHHLPKKELPPTEYIVNPHLRLDDKVEGLCGCGVVFYFLRELEKKLKGVSSLALVDDVLKEYLPIVAVATIADMVPLFSDNRTIVKKGLKDIMNGSLGVGRLLKRLFPEKRVINTSHIGYVVAPMINACSRISSPTKAFKLLTSSRKTFEKVFQEVLTLNELRKQELKRLLEHIEEDLDEKEEVLILALGANLNKGLFGLAASRLVEKYQKPAIILGKNRNKKTLSGSGRSVYPVSLYELVQEARDKVKRFGGHSVALGLEVEENLFEEFKKEVFRAYLKIPGPDRIFFNFADLEIDLIEINERNLKKLLTELSPFGSQFPEPVFLIKNAKISKYQGFSHAIVEKDSMSLNLELQPWEFFKSYTGTYDIYITPILDDNKLMFSIVGLEDPSVSELVKLDLQNLLDEEHI